MHELTPVPWSLADPFEHRGPAPAVHDVQHYAGAQAGEHDGARLDPLHLLGGAAHETHLPEAVLIDVQAPNEAVIDVADRFTDIHQFPHNGGPGDPVGRGESGHRAHLGAGVLRIGSDQLAGQT